MYIYRYIYINIHMSMHKYMHVYARICIRTQNKLYIVLERTKSHARLYVYKTIRIQNNTYTKQVVYCAGAHRIPRETINRISVCLLCTPAQYTSCFVYVLFVYVLFCIRIVLYTYRLILIAGLNNK